MVKAAQANVDRLLAMKNFTRLVAPFDGVVTARNTDVGALINVGGAAGQELFVISDVKKLRVYVNVPQTNVPNVQPGHGRHDPRAGSSERDVRGDGRSVGAVGQRIVGHDADATRFR